MRWLLLAILASGCATDGGEKIEVGTYDFTASWRVAGFSEPATAEGTVTITAASDQEIAYRFTLHEQSGDRTSEDAATWSDANGFVLSSPTIGRAGTWILFPHMVRGGRCSGNAFHVDVARGTPMTCTFTRRP